MLRFWKMKDAYPRAMGECSIARPMRIGFFATITNIWRTLERLTYALERIQMGGIKTLPANIEAIKAAEYMRGFHEGHRSGFSEGHRQAMSFPFERPTTTKDFGGL